MKISLKNLLLTFAVFCFTVFCALQPAQAEEEHKDIYYVPFKVSKQAAQEKYDKWFASQPFSKSQYYEIIGKAVVKKDYVPSYYFVIDMTVNYSGSKNGRREAGQAKYTGEYSILASQQYEDIVTQAEISQYIYDNKIKAKDLNKISDAAKRAISCFSESDEQEHLQNIEANEIEGTSVNALQKFVNNEIIEKYKFDPTTFSYDCEYNKVQCYYMLSPIWVAEYNKFHYFIINGQNGSFAYGIDNSKIKEHVMQKLQKVPPGIWILAIIIASIKFVFKLSIILIVVALIVFIYRSIRRNKQKQSDDSQNQTTPDPEQKQEP